MPPKARTAAQIKKDFWRRVSKVGKCWMWLGGKTGRGYGTVWDGKKVVSAHVFSYLITKGSTRGLDVLHTCDNPCCVRPKHLFIGTHEQNMADRQAKGRTASGDKNGKTKLPEFVRKNLRNERRQASVAELASKYHVCVSTIRRYL